MKGNIGGGQYHLSHTDKYWALQTPIIVLLLFCVKRLISALLVKGSPALNINIFSSIRLQISLIVFLFNFGKALLQILTLNTFEDAIQPLAVEMYTITCSSLHAFQQDNL